jgi:hypothetical protein
MAKKHELSYNDKHKQSKSWIYIVVALVIIGIVIAGAVVVFSPAKTDPFKTYDVYNGFAFENRGEFWQTNVQLDEQLYEVPFYNHPLDISSEIRYDVNVTQYLIDVVNTISPKRNLIIAVRPDAGSVPVLAGVNVARITGKFYGVQTNSALYLEDEEVDDFDTQDFPIRNCEDATVITPIIYIAVNQTESGVYFDQDNQHCIILAGSDNDNLLEVADLLGYKLLGIMR